VYTELGTIHVHGFIFSGVEASAKPRPVQIAELLNTRPRETLGWKFPVEVLVEYLQLSQSNNLSTINWCCT